MGNLVWSCLADNFGRLPCRHLSIHDGSRNSDSLLTTTLFESVKFGAIKQLAKNIGQMAFENPGAVVFDRNAKPRLSLASYFNHNVWKNPGLFASVKRVVYAF